MIYFISGEEGHTKGGRSVEMMNNKQGDAGEKRPSKSFNEQQNMAEFAEEAITLRPNKASRFPPNLNKIPKE